MPSLAPRPYSPSAVPVGCWLQVRELIDVCPDLTEASAQKALELCDWK